MALQIPLGRGKGWTVVDNEDYEWLLAAGPWHLSAGGYARRGKMVNGVQPHMHTLISGAAMVDHANRDKLDNRRVNLRPATRTQNNWNAGLSRNNTSGLKGVSYDGNRNAWKANIGLGGQSILIGRYADPRDAALAYDRRALELYGEFACTNQDLGLVTDDGRELLPVGLSRRYAGGTVTTMRMAA